MDLLPRERDKLLLFSAALLAERRRARGLKLNHPEAVALISAAILEGAREGKSVAELMSAGREVLAAHEVMDGVAAFVSGGPDRGELVDAQVMLAGSDRVALDAVGVALLRHFGTTPQVATGPVGAQEQIARAVELGLGVAAAEQIDLVSDDADADELIAAVHEILATG